MSEPDPDFSVDSARRAAEHDRLGEWVRRFLASPGSDNAELGEQLTDPPRAWLGPTRIATSELHRLVGPPGEPVLRAVDDEYWRDDVIEMAEEIEADEFEPPPVIVTYRDDQLVLEDGNHRVEGLRRAGHEEVWAVVGFETDEALEQFRSLRALSDTDL